MGPETSSGRRVGVNRAQMPARCACLHWRRLGDQPIPTHRCNAELVSASMAPSASRVGIEALGTGPSPGQALKGVQSDGPQVGTMRSD